jgi:transcriptional regulator with XRE-family HTH domain
VFHVGDVIRKLRMNQSWTIGELAERCGLNKMTVSAVERGNNSKQETIESLANGLGVTVAQLYAPLSSVAPPGSTGDSAASAQPEKSRGVTYPDAPSGVQEDLPTTGGSPDVASSASRVLDLTSALLNASARFDDLATQCNEARDQIEAVVVTGTEARGARGGQSKPAKGHRTHGRSRASGLRKR